MRPEITSVEQAYELIGMDVGSFPNGRAWDKTVGVYEIFSKMVSCKWWLEHSGITDKKWSGGDDQFNASACDAALFLRDDLLKKTGHRIWGLTFTLFPNGKFKIDYDYDKPADYEETDETIEVDFSKDLLPRT